MKYTVTVAGDSITVEITAEGVFLNGKRLDADLVGAPDGPMSRLVMNGVAMPLALRYREGGGCWNVQVGGRVWAAEVVDEWTRDVRQTSRARAERPGLSVLKAPMPGMLLRWEVDEGQSVTRGAGLVVLEAMKMENEIRAPGDAVVRRILVPPGTAVEKGTPLLELKSAG